MHDSYIHACEHNNYVYFRVCDGLAALVHSCLPACFLPSKTNTRPCESSNNFMCKLAHKQVPHTSLSGLHGPHVFGPQDGQYVGNSLCHQVLATCNPIWAVRMCSPPPSFHSISLGLRVQPAPHWYLHYTGFPGDLHTETPGGRSQLLVRSSQSQSRGRWCQ